MTVTVIYVGNNIIIIIVCRDTAAPPRYFDRGAVKVVSCALIVAQVPLLPNNRFLDFVETPTTIGAARTFSAVILYTRRSNQLVGLHIRAHVYLYMFLFDYINVYPSPAHIILYYYNDDNRLCSSLTRFV